MRSQNRKVNNIGRAGCLGLLALGLALANPVGMSVYAEEMPEETEGDETINNDIEPYAETPSTVNISFLPTAATGTVTPVDTSNGEKAKVDVKATVRVRNSGGYKVYVGSNSSQLKNGENVIDSVAATTTYANLPLNRWGYSFQEGSTVKDSYEAMPETLRGAALYSNTSTNITDETKTFTLSFAARIGSDKPAGTYSNSVTMSVVSSPLAVAEEFAYDFGGIADMQAMTSAICNAAPVGGVKQLRDSRDGKYYWIGKMKDGKCWMTQNLDLDLNEKTLPLKAATSDVNADWMPMNGEKVLYTANIVNSSTILPDNVGQRSWSLGDYSIMNPTDSTSCDSGLESAEACSGSETKDRFKYYVTPTTANGDTNAHYILGNHYQWNAATAGTGGIITSGRAEGSVCPKGWRLPESNTDIAGSFGELIRAYSASTSVTELVSAPLYFVRGGYVNQDIYSLFAGAGYGGNYWSSTPASDGSIAYYLSFFYVSSIAPSASGSTRDNGRSVRCIAR